jgi:heme/copper-type cytochrome/quinol oxidase subunit 3
MTAVLDASALARPEVGRRTSGYWGMALAVATEAALFATVLSAYWYVRLNSDTWPIPGIERPKLLLAGIGTVLLILSSVSYVSAERALRADRLGRARVGLAITTVLGVVFLIVQSFEWRDKHFGIGDNAYGTAFYTVTGLHGAHVIGGLLMVLFVQLQLWRNAGAKARHAAMQNVGLYWHFVGVVWLFVFGSLYLSEHL